MGIVYRHAKKSVHTLMMYQSAKCSNLLPKSIIFIDIRSLLSIYALVSDTIIHSHITNMVSSHLANILKKYRYKYRKNVLGMEHR